MPAVGGEAYFALALECRLSPRLRSFPRRPLYARFPPRSCENSITWKAMRERPGSAVGLPAVRLSYGESQAALIAWMSGGAPKMAIIRFSL
jgi:hypothetical protein